MSGELPPSVNIEEPRWDQSTFAGRASHFFTVTDPRNILLSDRQLERAAKIVRDYRYRGLETAMGGRAGVANHHSGVLQPVSYDGILFTKTKKSETGRCV